MIAFLGKTRIFQCISMSGNVNSQDAENLSDAQKINETLNLSLAKCLLPIDRAWSLPPLCYTKPQITDLEIANIFQNQWFCVGRADQMACAGDYTCIDFFNLSIILVRDNDLNYRAFANTCRHRGARLLDGSGKIGGIRCPFHSWAYKLDGSLAGAPHMEAANDFCKSEFNLISYKVNECLGFLFVCLSHEGPELENTLLDFSSTHSPWPIETLMSRRLRSFEVDCNWKMFLEVFNEYYHLPFVHPNSIDDVYRTPDPSDSVNGAFASQFGGTDGTGGLLQTTQQKPLPLMPGISGKEAAGVRYSWVFPNMTFAIGIDAMWVYHVYPLTSDRCLVYQTACFPPETIQHDDFDDRVVAYYHRLDAALAEDIPALTNQQKGLSNPDAQQGRFQPLLEPNVARFANWYAAQMMR